LRDFPAARETAFRPINTSQARYAGLIGSMELVFGLGPAGTGKTYVAGMLAAEALLEGRVKRIIATRPIVEAGEELGFLPGELEEKTAPYFRPLREVLERRLGRGHVEALIKGRKIEMLPLAFMRGHSFQDAFVILDEAQNTTPTQMKMFLTRQGEGSVVVVDGDSTQKDIPGPSGLVDAVRRLRDLPSVGVHRFTREDIVRSGLVQAIVERYEEPDEAFEAEVEDATAGLQRVLDLRRP
jgi:phosphate starvation-inducible PhoH-like protein